MTRLLSLSFLLEDEEVVLAADFLAGDFFLGAGDLDRFEDFVALVFFVDLDAFFFVVFFGVFLAFASTTPFSSYVNLAGGPVLRLDDLRSAGIFLMYFFVVSVMRDVCVCVCFFHNIEMLCDRRRFFLNKRV